MKRLLLFVAMAVVGLAAVQMAAQNPPPKPQQHVITDQDLQQRYHNDNAQNTDTSTTTDSGTTQTDQTTSTDQTTGTNDADDLKKQLEKKQKELERLKHAHSDIGVFITSTQKELAASNDDEDKANLQKRLDENMQDQQKNEADQKRVEKEISDLQDQIKDAENSGQTTPTAPTTNNSTSTETTNQTENNSSTETSNQTQSNTTTTENTNPPQL